MCVKGRIQVTLSGNESAYKAGYRYCRRCELFLFQGGKFCPCCGMALRASPSSRMQKEKLRESQTTGLMKVTGTVLQL